MTQYEKENGQRNAAAFDMVEEENEGGQKETEKEKGAKDTDKVQTERRKQDLASIQRRQEEKKELQKEIDNMRQEKVKL